MNSLPQGEKLASYSSPSEQYTVVIYLCNGGATVDYSIRGELIDHSTDIKKNIYWSYHESEAKVEWIDETTVMINNKRLNIETDIYDWRQE